MTSIIVVKLFVTMAQLVRGQTSVNAVKNGACRVKICLAGENYGMQIVPTYKNSPCRLNIACEWV